MANFFKFNDKEGKGVGKGDLSAPAYIRFFKVFFMRIANMVGLNLLYLFCCLPVITIGPATAGLTYVMRNYSQGKHVDMTYDFLRKAKEYFKPGLIITLIDLALGALLFFSINIWSDKTMAFDGTIRVVALVVLFFVAYIFVCANFYIFPMMISFDIPLKKLIRNSLLLASGKVLRNVAMVLVNGLFVLLFLFYWQILFPMYLLLIFSFCALFNNFMVFPVLVKHVAEKSEEPAESDENSQEEDIVFKDPH